jgi:aryl-alcohol dehydrogenase-like predicted oxidoreductase
MREASRADTLSAGSRPAKRLRTDWLDIYFVHAFDVRTPIEQTLRALDDPPAAEQDPLPGRQRLGRMADRDSARHLAREGLARFELIQPMYNLVRRQAEVEILPLAAAEKLGVIIYSPLGGGLLTGKYGTHGSDRAPGAALAHLSRSVRCLG